MRRLSIRLNTNLTGSSEGVMKKIYIYTDGACRGNPGPGGFGALLCYGEHRKELSGGFKNTTNNRMEIMAVLAALKALKQPCSVVLCSDSKYVIDALSKGWAEKWRAAGWMRTRKDKALNADLWEQVLSEVSKHSMEYIWVKGHDGHPENELCDKLAVSAAEGSNLPDDVGYGEN